MGTPGNQTGPPCLQTAAAAGKEDRGASRSTAAATCTCGQPGARRASEPMSRYGQPFVSLRTPPGAAGRTLLASAWLTLSTTWAPSWMHPQLCKDSEKLTQRWRRRPSGPWAAAVPLTDSEGGAGCELARLGAAECRRRSVPPPCGPPGELEAGSQRILPLARGTTGPPNVQENSENARPGAIPDTAGTKRPVRQCGRHDCWAKCQSTGW